MSLPIAQQRVLAYLGECSPSGTGDIAKALRMNRDKVRGALNGLAAKGLVQAEDREWWGDRGPRAAKIVRDARKATLIAARRAR